MTPDNKLHILLPIDLDGRSDEILHYAANIANETELPIHIKHVISPFAVSGITPMAGQTTYLNSRSELLELQREINTKFGKEIISKSSSNLDFKVEAIIESSEKEGCCMIVMATDSEFDLIDRLIGSIENSVVQQANVPIAFLPPEADISIPQHFFLVDINGELDPKRVEPFMGMLEGLNARLTYLLILDKESESALAADKLVEELRELVHQDIHFNVIFLSSDNPVETMLDKFEVSPGDTLVFQSTSAGYLKGLMKNTRTQKVLSTANTPVWVI